MKIILNTTAKTIKLETEVLFQDLIDTLEQLLPNGLWKEFKLELNTQQFFDVNPFIPYVPIEPYRQPWITYTDSPIPPIYPTTCNTSNILLVQGTYHLEI